jgi:hypothetical protein
MNDQPLFILVELRGNALVRYPEGEGHEYHLLFVAIGIVLTINGEECGRRTRP